MKKIAFLLASVLILSATSLLAQPEPGNDSNPDPTTWTWSSSNIWSKNMELIKSVRMNTPANSEQTTVAEYIHIFEYNSHVYICDAQNEWVWDADFLD